MIHSASIVTLAVDSFDYNQKGPTLDSLSP